MSPHYTTLNIRISTYILWPVFHILTKPVLYTFVSANRWNNEYGPALRYSVDLWIQTYTEPVALNMENSPQNTRGHKYMFTAYQ